MMTMKLMTVMKQTVPTLKLKYKNFGQKEKMKYKYFAHPEIEIQKLWPEIEIAKIRSRLNFEGIY